MPHRAVVRLVRNANYISFSNRQVFLQLAPISFDASTLEIWGCLLNGARLVVFPPQTPSLAELAETLERHQVTTVWLTSGLFNQMVEEKPEGLKHLRQILTGGDVLSPTHVKKALALLDRCRLINGYGPTENTTFTACYPIPASYGGQRSIPIGRPISNTQCYVLDERLQPVPVGIPGELYAGGDGLALGYLNQPELTAERFIANPFQPGSRMYKTGDLVRYLADGNIEFLGRKDFQVKIRGFRVELGEIESVLARHPLVRECVVMARQDFPGEKRLTAYIVADDGEEPVARELRQFLKGKLPDYMAPSVYMRLKALPLMPNGKVDRHALPMPDDGKTMIDKEYVKAGDALEVELTTIWESILNTRPIGVEDKFFDLGGHSLLAVRLVAQVEKKFGRKFPVAVVFQAPTIREMAGFLRAEKSVTKSSSLVEIQAKGTKPPLYFVHGVGGGMFWGYTNLARSLGLDQPVYALKSRAMDGEEEFSRIEAMAAQYVADVRELQPKGPYHLGGYCFGGNVAYEMARQLHAAGETVALLAVMNAAPPNSSYGRLRWTPGGVIKFLVNFSYLAARSLNWGARQRKEFLLWKAALSRRRVMRFFKIPHAAAKQIDVDNIVDLSTFPQDQRTLWEIHIRALIGYFPQRYDGKVTLFRSRGHPLFSSFDPQFGWGDLAGEVEVQAVPGAHESILEEPHVRILAEKLKGCLRRTQGDQTVSSNKRSSMDDQSVSITIDRSNRNETQADFPRDLCIHHLFEEQVKRTPDAPALLCAGEELSYQEVNRRANQIAHHLQSLGVGPDVPVGICLNRSINLVVGMLGILKAGGAYVPLDPAYPQERLALMLEDAQAPILLTQTELASSLPAEQRKIVCLDQSAATEALAHNPVRGVTAQSLAYVIYTSGSTGRPKGVAMAHQPLVNLIWWQLKNSSLAKGDRTLQFSSPSFDVSFQEIFSTWCSGGVLVLIDEQLRHDAPGLRRFLHEQKINRLFLPFIALSQLAESINDQDPLPADLREVITAGEQLRITAKIAALFEKLPGCVLFNHYGPTESHVVTSFALNGPPGDWPPLPPIGRPISNTQIHLLDEKQNAVPAGETGELYIGGECLARGYLHRPDLTAERFIPDPFSIEPLARLYKTGDLARLLPDGNIEYIGRADQQVKIHGYRVELGEIETVLGTHPAVRECAVMAREDVPGQKRLVGYVVLQPGWEVTITGLRHALEEKLPDYMVPSSFVFLEALPVTPSGKVNRLGLPAPDQNRPRLDEQFVAPSNDTEERLAAIWREVLSLKQVGTQDNFFELGGNSLMVGQVVSRVRETFKLELPARSLFDAPTIAALAQGISTGGWGHGQPTVPPIKRGGAGDQAPLSFAQRRLWFIDRLEPGGHAYNVPVAIHLQGTLNPEALQMSLEKIVRRHESLRTVISFAGGKLTQAVLPEPGAILSHMDLGAWPASQQKLEARKVVDAEARRPFNLALGPLLRCTLIRLGEREHIFVVVMHHIISDGWSLAVFFKELNLLYKALATGKPPPMLPALPVQYRDYARCQQEWMQGTVLEGEVSYWKEKLKDAPSSIELPLDHNAELESATRSALSSVILPLGLAREMADFGRRESITPFMTMMAGLAITFHQWTRQSDMVIGTVVAGRNQQEIENLIGCFMNFVPVRSKLRDAKTGREFLAQVKAAILEAQAHQDCPFEKIVEAINPERRLAQNPLYNVAFLMQNFPAETFDAKGLQATLMPVDLQTALLDLRFIAEETAAGLSLVCEYKVDLFKAETIQQFLTSFCGILAALIRDPQKPISEFELMPELAVQGNTAKNRDDRQTIAVAATFTAEPLEESLKYWMRELEIPARLEFAPYNQVFQQLLDPASLLSTNQRGINVVLVRFEDWEQFEQGTTEAVASGEDRVMRNVDEFLRSLKAAVNRNSAPWVICVCPASKPLMEKEGRAAFCRQMELRMAAELESLGGVHLVTTEEMGRLYPVADRHDPRTEELGSIPYTPVYFAALGTMIARKFHAVRRQPFKVIVLDCDETLWAGVCGEDGPNGIQLDAPRQALQEFMRAQCAAGMLLCLCSKNNEEDVINVFERRREMPLGREHFTAWRINWRSKSENLKSLADELRLGLDSFIFIDDNAVECAEVEANCPAVLTLQLPESPGQIPQFLNHCWAFDHLKVSVEDRQRTAFYQQDRQREQLRSQSLSLGEFLAGLDLKVDIAGLSEEDLMRASQLTERTNQFNFTTRRRAASEFREMLRTNEPEALAVSVSDRLGAYGLVGLIIYEDKGSVLNVDTFLLSCRVLGRGVEYQMIAWLGRIALARGLGHVDLHFTPSAKNQPAFNFLEKVGARFRQASNGGYLYRLPAKFAAAVTFNAAAMEEIGAEDSQALSATEKVRGTAPGERTRFGRYRWIALEANDPGNILRVMGSKWRPRTGEHPAYAAAQSETEKLLCKIWEELLRVERVGIHDNFFEMGGHSLLAVRLFAEVEKLTGRKLPLVTIFQNSTVKQLAEALRQTPIIASSSLVAIRAQGSQPPLFLIHGAGGDVLWGYANLAPYLGPEQPVYGIKSRALNGAEELGCIEDMATYYLEQLRGVQKTGPYYLGGYCFGGNVAYEMARQLRDGGEQVALVALLDSAPSNAGYEKMKWWRPGFSLKFAINLYYWLHDFFKAKPEERWEYICRKGRAWRRKLVRRLLHREGSPAEVDLEEVIDVSRFSENELRLWQIHLNLLNKHVSRPYAGKVTLFRTRGQPMFCSLEDDFGWGKLAAGGVEIKMVPGSHESVFMEPEVRSLAGQLKVCLAEINQETEAESPELKTA